MNLALPALVIILLVTPGVLFSYSYRKGIGWRSPVSLDTFQNELGKGLLWAILINLVGVQFVKCLGWYEVDFPAFLSLLSGWPDPDNPNVQGRMEAVALNVQAIALYLLVISTASIALGFFSHWIVRKNALDLRYNFLTFNNEWSYLFSGEARAFDTKQSERTMKGMKALKSSEPDFVFVSAIVDQGGESTLYWGVLSDFHFKAGQLDRVVMRFAQRRTLAQDSDGAQTDSDPITDRRFYAILGDYLVIPYGNIKNLNVGYRWLPDEDEIEEDRAADAVPVEEASTITGAPAEAVQPEAEPPQQGGSVEGTTQAG